MNHSMVYLSQLNLEEMIREYREEEAVRLMNMIIENSKKILKLQKTLVKLMYKEKKKQERCKKMRRREYNEKQGEKEQRRRK